MHSDYAILFMLGIILGTLCHVLADLKQIKQQKENKDGSKK